MGWHRGPSQSKHGHRRDGLTTQLTLLKEDYIHKENQTVQGHCVQLYYVHEANDRLFRHLYS